MVHAGGDAGLFRAIVGGWAPGGGRPASRCDESTPLRTVLDPTGERRPPGRVRLPDPVTLAAARVGLLDIPKPRGDVVLDRLEELLTAGACRLAATGSRRSRSRRRWT